MELGLPEALVTSGIRLCLVPAVPVLPAVQGSRGARRQPVQPNESIAAASRLAASLSSI